MKTILLAFVFTVSMLNSSQALEVSKNTINFSKKYNGEITTFGPTVFASALGSLLFGPVIGAATGAAVSTVEGLWILIQLKNPDSLYAAEVEEGLFEVAATGATQSFIVEELIVGIQGQEEILNIQLARAGIETRSFALMSNQDVALYLLNFEL